MQRELDPRTSLVVGLCAYEMIAILSGSVPTLTSLAWRTRHTWWGKAIVWNGVGYLAWHLLEEEAVTIAEENILND